MPLGYQFSHTYQSIFNAGSYPQLKAGITTFQSRTCPVGFVRDRVGNDVIQGSTLSKRTSSIGSGHVVHLSNPATIA